jgi:acyl-CoA synthetase (NDP forming)/GNAT superfamily N-acetyltransferase
MGVSPFSLRDYGPERPAGSAEGPREDGRVPDAPEMPEPAYPREWESDVVLADGGTAHLRPLRRDDSEKLLDFFTRLSDRSRMLRFFAPVSPQTARRAARLDEVDYDKTFGIVAELGDDLIAVGTYQRTDDPAAAEVAFAVSDEHQARGIGSILLEQLASVGRTMGLRRFTASTLPENRRMLRVFHEAGWEVDREHVEGVVELSFPIDDDEKTREVLYRREHLAEARSMERLLHPQSIAVIGASREPHTPGHDVLVNIVAGGFTGSLHAVNLAAVDEVAGVPCVARVTDVEGPVDLAVVAVPAAAVDAVVADCGVKGVHGLVVLSAAPSGRDERDRFEQRLVESARRLGMRILGPECLGMVNTDPETALQATVAAVRPRRGRIGWSSQSGAIGLDLLVRATDAGLGVSTFVSLGDKADVSGNDLLQYWDADPDTDVILLYMESFGNPRKFARIARRVARRKPVVAVKSARSAAGSRGAAVRTTTRDDPDAAVDALFAQAGVVRVDTLEDLLVTAAAFEACPLPAGDRVAVIGNAVGPAVLASDACVAAGLTVPEPGEARLDANPVHLPSTVSADEYAVALRTALASDGVDAVLAVVVPRPGLDDEAVELRRIIGRVAGEGAKPVVASVLGQRELIGHAGLVPTFAFAEHAAAALGRIAEYARWRRRPGGAVPDLDGIDQEAAHELVAAFLTEHPVGGPIDGPPTARLLATYGVVVDPPPASPGAEPTLGVSAGVEASVHVDADPRFGPVLTFQMGGTQAELLRDASVCTVPLTDVDAHDLIRAPRTSALMFGQAGAASLDTVALEELVLRVAQLADDVPELTRLHADLLVTPAAVHLTRATGALTPAPHVPTGVRRMRPR